MKKFLLSVAVLLASVCAGAQVLSVGALTRVNGVVGDQPAISPDGRFIVVSHSEGLVKVDVATGQQELVAKGGGIYNVQFTADGNNLVFVRPTTDKNHLRKISLESVDLTSGNVKVLVKPSRTLAHGVAVTDGTVTAIQDGRRQTKRVAGAKAAAKAVATINYGHLDVTTADGKTTSIDPQGRGSYLWASVSPNGERVLYWLVGKGCFTCNLDGSDVQRVGGIRAAVWADDNTVIGMDEREAQAQRVAESFIVAVDLRTGEQQRLTDNSVRAQFPAVSADGKRIAFNTTNGEIYVLDINK